METNSEVTYFAHLVEALEPWLNQVVVIGGWGTGFTERIRLRRRSIANRLEHSMPMSRCHRNCRHQPRKFGKGC